MSRSPFHWLVCGLAAIALQPFSSQAQVTPPRECDVDFRVLVDVSGSMYVDREPYRGYNQIRTDAGVSSLLDYTIKTLDAIGRVNPPVLRPTTSVSVSSFYASLRPRPFDWPSRRGHLFDAIDLNRDGRLNALDFPDHTSERKTDLAIVLDQVEQVASARGRSKPLVFLIFTDGVHETASDLRAAAQRVRSELQTKRRFPTSVVFFGFGPETQAGYVAAEVGASYLDFTNPAAVPQLESMLRGLLAGTPYMEATRSTWDGSQDLATVSTTIVNPGCNAVLLPSSAQLEDSAKTRIGPNLVIADSLRSISPYGRMPITWQWTPVGSIDERLAGTINLETPVTRLTSAFDLSIVHEPFAAIESVELKVDSSNVVTTDIGKRPLLLPLDVVVRGTRYRASSLLIPVRLELTPSVAGDDGAPAANLSLSLQDTGPVGPFTIRRRITADSLRARLGDHGTPRPASLYSARAKIQALPTRVISSGSRGASSSTSLFQLATGEEISVAVTRTKAFQHLLWRRARFDVVASLAGYSAAREVRLTTSVRGVAKTEVVRLEPGQSRGIVLWRYAAGTSLDSVKLSATIADTAGARPALRASGDSLIVFSGPTAKVSKALVVDIAALAFAIALGSLAFSAMRKRYADD